eukprot:scaffold65637_cov16-Tisochrysis_lutea.AAC.1
MPGRDIMLSLSSLNALTFRESCACQPGLWKRLPGTNDCIARRCKAGFMLSALSSETLLKAREELGIWVQMKFCT